MAKLGIDELNINSQKRERQRVGFETYFGEMELSEQEKKERISLAKALEAAFMHLLLMFPDESYDDCYEYIDSEYRSIATKFINAKETPAALLAHIAVAISAVLDATTRHYESDEYYLSEERASYIAANESNAVGNYREQVNMVNKGYKYKVWVAMKDQRTRRTHIDVDGMQIGIFEPFTVGDCQLMFPKDTSLGATPEETANCRCVLKYKK